MKLLLQGLLLSTLSLSVATANGDQTPLRSTEDAAVAAGSKAPVKAKAKPSDKAVKQLNFSDSDSDN
jgi:hypothetical protein